MVGGKNEAAAEHAAAKTELAGCPQCDLLMTLSPLSAGQRAVCPRCGALIRQAGTDPIGKPLALAAAALLLFFPANVLPILALDILGHGSVSTVVGAVQVLFSGGLSLVGLMVLFCSILAPLAAMGLLFVVLFFLRLGRGPSFLPGFFRFYLHLDSWAMLEVYMIGLLVSIVKLLDMARVDVGIGLFCFIGLLITSLAAKAALDRTAVWERIEALCNR
jgi:paraquat-inducible protein A